jgi:hypothetical protein
VARPLSVFISTWFSKIPRNEKVLLAAIAPRGIVAVSVASLFAIELEEAGFAAAEQLVNITFTVVVGSVIVSSLVARPLAVRLGITQKHPQGTLIVGAHHWARQIAAAIKNAGFDVWLVDTNSRHIENAKQVGLAGFHDSIMADGIVDELPMECIGRLLALTDNDELNTLAAVRYGQWLGDDHVYQLVPGKHEADDKTISGRMRGHTLFKRDITFRELDTQYFGGKEIVLVQDNAVEKLATYRENGVFFLVLFVITNDGRLLVSTADNPATPRSDEAAIIWVDAAAARQVVASYIETVPISP